jgi:hypothetical protein
MSTVVDQTLDLTIEVVPDYTAKYGYSLLAMDEF